jgi:fructose-1,6-bisphosphatase/inositol monophosphatase family enzyme
MHSLSPQVEALIRQTATEIVLPRFRNLLASEISEKSPGDHVTIADHESEVRLSEGLARILPEARVIGEEACAADPSVMEGINEGFVWIIDPIDGTSNFAQGIAPFGLMVALLNDGEREAGWMFDPVTARMCHAARDQGAFINGERITARESGSALPIAAIATGFLPEERRADIERRADGKLSIVPIPRCAAEQYPRIALGTNDIALFERSLPWDHAPGALFVEEAGGVIRRNDGSEYRVGDGRTGLLGAASPRLWDEAARILFG